jgi:hypothetical protein
LVLVVRRVADGRMDILGEGINFTTTSKRHTIHCSNKSRN